jgi:hypothetical protein
MYKLYTDDTVTIEDFKDKPKAKKQKVSSQPSDALDRYQIFTFEDALSLNIQKHR